MTTYLFLSRSDQSRCRFCLGNLFLQFAPCSRIQAIKVEAVWLCSSKLLSCFNRRGTLKARGTAVRLQTCEGTVMALCNIRKGQFLWLLPSSHNSPEPADITDCSSGKFFKYNAPKQAPSSKWPHVLRMFPGLSFCLKLFYFNCKFGETTIRIFTFVTILCK